MRKFFLFFLPFFLFTNSLVFSQEIPPINIFTTENYGAENQNWDISQASNKFIYVANNEGLLEFNGEEWQLYPTPNETIMRSVKCFEDKIFTGFYRDFGYWEKNELGNLEFNSLVLENTIEMLEDEQIWEISELDGWMVFKSLQRIYLYNLKSKSLKTINANKNITKLSRVENTIYYQEIDKGIFMIENGVPKLISDAKILKENKLVDVFYKEGKLFFITQKLGIFYLENNKLIKWQISSNTTLSNVTIYSSKVLKNGNIVLGTISNGIIKLTKSGDIFYEISQSSGLSNNTVLSVFEDLDENIWLGLDNGINNINLRSPFKLFIKKNNFWGTIYTSIVYNNYLFVGTNQGLYYRKINSDESFTFLENTQGQVWNLQEIDNALFCSHDSGTFVIENLKAKLISKIEGSWNIQKLNNTTLIQGNYDGLYVLNKVNNTWKIKNKIEGFSNSSRYFIINNENEIFVNHEYKGVFKLKINDDFTKVVENIKDESVEKGIHSSLIRYNNKILYSCKKGVFEYDYKQNKFKKDSILSRLMPKDKFLSAKLLFDKSNNKLWSFTKDDIRYIKPGKLSETPDLNIIPVKGSIHKGASGYENIIHLKEKEYLIGTSNGYLVVDLNKIKPPRDFNITINTVYSNRLDEKPKKVSLKEKLIFENNQNSIRFLYSVANFNKTASIKYQYKLEGLNEKWGTSSKKSSFLYENLPPGDYTFKVRSLIDDKLSENIATFPFQISKPWYFSSVLIFLYIVLFGLAIIFLQIFTRRYYKKQKQDLLEKAQKELELKELENNQKIIKINNDKLRGDIESKNRELATSTMSIIKKNEFLNSIKSQLLSSGKDSIDKVVSIIDKNLNNTDDWKLFQEAFNNADKNFLKKIKAKHTELTPNDLRLCAYLRLNLSSKEIAPLLNISPRSVEVKRYRLRKKMNLPHNSNLTNYIIEI